MKFEAVGFDYGNTLVLDPFEKVMSLKANDFVKIMEKNGYEITKKKLIDVWRDVNLNVNYPFCSHFAQEIPLLRELLERLGVKRNDCYKISQQLLVAYRSGLKQVLKKDAKIEKTKEVLEVLKNRGKKLFIISNEKVHTLNAQLYWTGLYKFFDRIIVSQKLGVEKPEIRIFKYALKFFDFPNDRILFVGDDPLRDIKPAKSIGLKTALLEHPKEMSCSWRAYDVILEGEEKPDFVIKDLSELLNIVK